MKENWHARRIDAVDGHRDVYLLSRLHRSLRNDLRLAMLFDYILGGIFSIGILVYLVYALARPEKF